MNQGLCIRPHVLMLDAMAVWKETELGAIEHSAHFVTMLALMTCQSAATTLAASALL